MTKFSKLIIAATTTALLSFPVMAQELVLRGASYMPLEATLGIPFKRFADHINETGKGVLQMKAMGPEAIPATEQPNALRSGLLDIVAIPAGTYKQIIPESNAQDISDMSLAEMRATGGYDALNKLMREKMNAELLTTFGNQVPFHIYLNQEIKGLDDLKGMRLRGQPIFGPLFEKLGVSMMTVPVPETYTALERGVVQGYAFAIWGIQDFGWDKVTKYRLEPGFYSGGFNIMMNKGVYDKLTPEQRKVLTDTIAWFEPEMDRYREEQHAINKAAQEAAGIKPILVGDDFPTLAADAQWDALEKASPETIPALRKMLSK